MGGSTRSRNPLSLLQRHLSPSHTHLEHTQVPDTLYETSLDIRHAPLAV